MFCLSIRQPWAWLIVKGFKDIENRSWGTKFKGPILIHASSSFDEDTLRDVEAVKLIEELIGRRLPMRHEYPRGGIVGACVLTGCLPPNSELEMLSPWYTGDYGFQLQQAIELPFLQLRGALGFFGAQHGKLIVTNGDLPGQYQLQVQA